MSGTQLASIPRLLSSLKVVMAAVSMLGASTAFAQPGTILLTDSFDDGAACGNLSPNWTTTDASLGDIGTFTSSSGSCSAFTRGAEVSITSVSIDASGIQGADLTAFVQKGADSFSEDPDTEAENLVIEYLDATGTFIVLQTFSNAVIADGAVILVNVSLPFGALHENLQIRFRQLGGSGGPPANGGLGFDFWHFDDVVLTETGVPPPPPPPPTLTPNSCDDFEGGLANWTVSNPSKSDINGATFNSPSNSLFLSEGGVTATSVSIPATGLEQITVFVQRGSDAFSENPDAGEDLVFEFLDDTGVFVELETFSGAGTPGEVFNRTFVAPASARHAAFQMRLRYDTGSGVGFDFWHVDDVCLVSELPDLSVVKTVVIESNPSQNLLFALPGAYARYTIEVTNNGAGVVDAGTLDLSDVIDPKTDLFVGDLNGAGSPFVFNEGIGAAESGVSLNYSGLGDGTDGVVFRNDGGLEIVPTPDFDPSVSSFHLSFDGAMLGGADGTPTMFSVEYRVRLQ